MGDTQSAQQDAEENAVEDTERGRARDSDAEDQLLQNNGQISILHGKSDDPLTELTDHIEDEVIDEESALVSAREEVSDTFETVDDQEALLEDVEINDRTESDPDADEAGLNEKEYRMNEINNGFRRFFSNIGLKLTVKQGTDEKQAKTASDAPAVPNREEEPSSLGDICDMANESVSETDENNADHHLAQDSADNESTTCPTVTDMTSEDMQENVEDKTTAATEVNQEAVEGISAHADTEGVTTSEVEPEASSPQKSAEEEVLSPIKVFFTTGIFSSLRKKKTDNQKNELNEKELVDMVRREQGGTEEIGKDLKKDKVCPSAERAVVEEKQKTEKGNEEVILESAPTTNGHGIGENLLTANEELLSSQEKVKAPSSPLQRLLSGTNFKKVSTKQRGRKKSSDSTEHISDHLQTSVESAESMTEEIPAVAPEEVKKLEESAWELFKRLLTPKKFQKSSILSNKEAVVSSTPEEPKPSEGEEIADASTEESRKRKDSIVSWDTLLCGNRRSRKSSNADEQKPKAEGDNRPASESRHATDLDSSHEIDDNLASSPEQGGSPSEDEGSTWKSFKRLVTPKRKARDGEETKDHTSDSEIIQDESLFSLKKFLPGRKKRRPSEKQEQVPSDKPEREEQSDEEDSETPAVIPLSEFDIPETESQVKTQAVIESQTPEAEDHEGQEEVTGQTTEAIVMSNSTPALPEESKDTETALENPTSTTLASMEEVDDLTEFISKLQQLSDIPEEGLIEESVASPASFAEDAARDDTIADIIEFTSEAVTAPEPVDITAEDETEMVSAASQLTDSSKTSGNTTPVPAEYDVKETDGLLYQVVESISATPNEALVSASDQIPKRIAGSVPLYQILEISISKELTILKPHQTSDATLLCTSLTVEAFDAIDKVVVMEETECLSEIISISTQCLSEDTTEEFHTAGISVDEELKYVNESQPVVDSSSEEYKAMTTEVSPQVEDVHVAEISIDHKNDNEQANEMAPPGTDAHVEPTIQTDNEALSQTNEALEGKCDQIKESTTDDEAQVQIDETIDESKRLTLTDACVSINSEELIGAQADETPATSEATPTDEKVKGTDLLRSEQMQDVTELNVGDEEQHELLVVEVDVAEVEHVPVSAPIEPEEVIIEADKSNSQLQSCSSVDVEQAQQGSVQELESQSITEDIPVQDSTVPDSSITSTEGEYESVALEQMQHTTLETEMYIKEDAAEILQDVQVEGGDQKTEVAGELQTETSVEETVYCEERNVQVLEHKVISEDSLVLEEEKDDDKETVMQPEQSLTDATVDNELTEVPQHISVEEDGQLFEVTNELEEVTSVYMCSVNHDVTIIQTVEKQFITEDNAESQAENVLPSSTSEVEKELAIESEQGLAEKELVSIANDPCDDPRQVLIQEDGQLTEVTNTLETLPSLNVASVIYDISSVQVFQKQVIPEDNTESQAEDAMSEVEKETAIVIEQGLAEKELVSIENDPCDEPRQVLLQEDGQLTEVTDEFETSQSVHAGTLNSEARIVEIHQKQIISEDIGSNTENASTSITDEDEKETVTQSEQLLEKEFVTVGTDPREVPQQIPVEDLGQIIEVTNELEESTFVHVPSVNCDASTVQSFEMQAFTEDNLESHEENALPASTSEVVKEAAIVTEQGLVEKEHVSIENDTCDVPRQVLVQEDGELGKVTDELETLTYFHVTSVNLKVGIAQVLEKQVLTDDNTESQAEKALPSSTSEVEKEAATISEYDVAEKELVSIENDPCNVPRQVLVQEDELGELSKVTDELETLTSLYVASVIYDASIVLLEKQVITEDNAESHAEDATREVENDAAIVIEQGLAEKKLVSLDNDPYNVPRQVLVQEDGKLIEVTDELETLTSVHVGSLNSEASIVEVHEKQVTSDNLGSNAENANTFITVEGEKETVTHSEQSLLEKELVTVESNLNEEPQRISVTYDFQVDEVTKELETSAYVASSVEAREKRVVSEDIPVPNGTSVTTEVENETGVLIEQALVEKILPTVDDDPNEISQQSIVKEDGEVVKVSMEFEAPPTVQIIPLISESSIVEVIEKQVTSEDLGSNAENANTLITAEDEKETHLEQSLLDKELVTVESNLNEEPQCISVTDDVRVTEVTKELEASTFAHVASVDSNAGIVEVLEKQVVSEDIPVPNGASASVTAEVDNETGVLIEQALVGKELPTVDDDPNEISQQSVVKEDGEVVKVSMEFEAPPTVQIVPLISESSIVGVIEKQVTSEDLGSNAENANTLITVEDEKETHSEQSLLDKELVTVESNLNEEPQRISVTDDVQVTEVRKELEASTFAHVASVDSNAGIVEVLEKPVVSEDIIVPDGASASVTAEVENETGVLIEQALVGKELPTVDDDPNEIPQQSVVKEDGEVVKVSTEFEASPSVQIAPLNSKAIIVEVHEKQVTSEDLGSNVENANTLITVKDEKETVTHSEQSLLDKELVTVERSLIEEPQCISVTDYVHVTEVSKELDASTSVYVASVDTNAGIIEVLENQVVSEDIPVPDGASASVTAEVENETGVLIEQALVGKELPTVDDDPNAIPQQSVVKEDGEVVKVSTEFEALPSNQIAPLNFEAIIVEVHEKQVTSDDLGSNAENANTLITVEDEKETVTHSEQSLLDKELVTVERSLIEEPQHISVTDYVHVTEVTKELEASTSVYVASVDTNAGIIEVLEKQVVSEYIIVPDGASASVTAEVENETGVLIEQALVENELPTMDDDPNESSQQSVVKEDGEVVKVSMEFEGPPTVQIAPWILESSIVEVIEKQVSSEDLECKAVNGNTLITAEDEKEMHSEQSLLDKELVTVESNLNEEPQPISVTDDVRVTEVTKELEASTFAHVASVDSNAGIVEVLEKQVVSEDIIVPDGASASVTAEVENETGVLIEQALVGKELPTVDDDPNEIPQQSVVKEDGEVVKVSKEFEAPPSVQIAPLNSKAIIVEVHEKQVTSEDLGYNAENANILITVEDEKETVTHSEQSLLDKELATVERSLIEEPQHMSVTDYVHVTEVTKELEASTSVYVASVDTNAGIIEVLENQVVSEDIPVPDGASASVTAEVENETGVLIEQALVENELPTMDDDPNESSQRSLVKEDGEVVKVSMEFEGPPTVQIAPWILESSIVEVIEKQVTSEDLGSNGENANTLITVEDEKETVTHSEQSLLDKELVTVESNLNEEPQRISVTDDVHVAEVTKELEASTSVHVAYVDSNAGIVEVLEKQVVSEDIIVPDGASASVTAEVENETGVLIEQALVGKELPTVDDDPNEIPQQSVVKEDGEVVKVSKEFEAPPSVQIAPLNSKAIIVEVHEKQVTSEDLGYNAENANILITVEDEKETVTHSEQSLLDKELATVERSLIEEPQHMSVTDYVHVTEVTKELEASTSVYVASVDTNAGIIEVLENQVVSEDIPVPDGASASVTAEVENETGVLIEQALVENELPTMDDDPNESSQRSLVKEDGEVVKVSMEFEGPPTVQIAPWILESSIVEVIEKQVTSEDLGSNGENANTLITVEDEKETVTHSEQSLLDKELVTVESNLNEEPQRISVTDDVQVAEVTKELEASTSVHVASVDSNAGIVEVLEKQVVSEDIIVPDGASASVTAEVENETGVLIEQALVGKELPTMDDDPNESSQQSVVKEDGEVVKASTESETPPSLQIEPLISESSIVEVIEKQVLPVDIPITNAEKVSASTTAEAEKEAAVLIEQALVEKDCITVVDDPNEIHIASLNSDTSTPQVQHVLPAIPAPDKENAHDSVTVEVEKVVVLTAVVEKEIQTIEGDPNEVPRYSAVENNDQLAEVTELLEAPTVVDMVSIAPETSVPQVIEKHVLSENISAPDTENDVALVVPEPSHEVVPTGVNVEGDIDEPAEVETNAEVVEDGAAMQDEDGAGMQAFKCGTKYVKTSTPNDTNTETPNITEPLLDVVATEEEPQQRIEPVRVLEPCVQEDIIEMAEEREVDAEVKSAEEVGVADAKEAMDVGCKVENEVGNVSTALATEETETDKVTTKEVDQQEQRTQVSEEEVKEESCLEEESVSAEQVVITLPTVEQEATEMTNEPSELEAQKVTENKSDASIERQPEVLSVTEIVFKEETASPHVLATTDDASIDEMKTDLEETKVELKKESDVHVMEEDSSCSPEVLAYNIQMEVTKVQVKEKVEPTIKMEVTEIQVTEKVEQNIQIAVTEMKDTERPEVVIQAIEAIEKEVSIDEPKTDLEETKVQLKKESDVHVIEDSSCSPEVLAVKEIMEAKQEQTYSCQVVTQSEEGLSNYPTIKMEVIQLTEKVQPKIQMEVTELQVKAEVEPTIKMEATEIQVIEKVEPNIEIALTEMKDSSTQPERPEVGVQAVEAIEPATPIKMAEVAKSLKEPGVSEVAATRVIEVTGLAKDSTTKEMIPAEPVALQVGTEQVEPTGSTGKAMILSQMVLSHSVVEPLETTPPHLVHIEQAERTVLSSQLVQSEVGVEVAKPIQQGEEKLKQDVWLDAEEDIGKQEGAEKTEIEPQESVESSQGDNEGAEFLDATEHAHIAKCTKCELEREGEDFANALEDPAMMNLTETSVISKELD